MDQRLLQRLPFPRNKNSAMQFKSAGRILALAAILAFCMASGSSQASESVAPAREPSLSESVRQLQLQIQQLQSAVQEIRQESQHYREETFELRRQLEATRKKRDAVDRTATTPPDTASAQVESPPAQETPAPQPPGEKPSLASRVDKLEEDHQLLDARVTEQYQTKVESASKYRVRLSGMLLFNLFSNSGYVDHLEVPGVALPSNPSQTGANTGGSFAATYRQSQFGLEVYGPQIAGARTQGNFIVDLFGEFPETVNGSASGMFRFRTGTIRLDWNRSSLVGGMDSIFFSPTYPTSFASVGIPPLSYSGNLWAWIPQLRVEHRMAVSEASTVTLSGGIFDPLTGEAPPNEFLRIPGAGESSRQPGYGSRLEWSHKVGGQPLTLGVGGYYNRENWGFDRTVDGWVANTDWSVPFGQYFQLSGKFYSGRAIGGLGAGVGRSVVFNGSLSNPATTVRGLTSTGGWAQLKFKPSVKFEVNAAGGQDGANAADLRGFLFAPGYFASDITRNRSEFANFIYRPRSNLLFSTEFRTLRTFSLPASSVRANQLNLIMGVLF
jgi:outer membrane murein-binding lipoprotein Lpp